MDNTYEKCVSYLEQIEPLDDRYEIIGVEKRLSFPLSIYKFIGIIDLILKDKKTGEIIIVDHKSSKHFLKKDGTPLKATLEEFNAYKKQMYLYCKAVENCMDLQVNKIVWHHFKDGGVLTVIPFDPAEYNNTVKWAENIIQDIKTDETFEAKQSYYRCKELCPFRETCEYLDDEEEEGD